MTALPVNFRLAVPVGAGILGSAAGGMVTAVDEEPVVLVRRR
jgi:hypothetical protein